MGADGFDDAGITLSDRPDLSDYQCNIGFKLAKVLKKRPLDIAHDVEECLKKHFNDEITVSVTPPGFVNITLKPAAILSNLLADDVWAVQAPNAQKIVMDYGGPNIAKPLHVGHIRSAVIGEAVKRILRYVGHEVVADVHLGDWGTQMGKVIFGLMHKYPDVLDSPEPIFQFEDLLSSYAYANKAFEQEENADRMREITHRLQQGDVQLRRVWGYLQKMSIQEIKRLYAQLGVSFDLWHGESRYQDAMGPLCDRLLAEGVAQEDDGGVDCVCARRR